MGAGLKNRLSLRKLLRKKVFFSCKEKMGLLKLLEVSNKATNLSPGF